MKNFVLGLSLAGNILLGYTILKETDVLDDLKEKVDSLSDQANGKFKQVAGTVNNDPVEKLEGDLETAKGDLKEKVSDIKDDFE
ncbi:CsbD family protein [Fructilactobacillus vespulae]|uniref:CsbD family protein n=1 Tax=Fructilactobacillus vespulae TaxID=1249630 RepID=UPI0039B6203B